MVEVVEVFRYSCYLYRNPGEKIMILMITNYQRSRPNRYWN